MKLILDSKNSHPTTITVKGKEITLLLIEFMRKDIRDELPMYTKLFILTSVGVLMNAPNRIIKGKFRA